MGGNSKDTSLISLIVMVLAAATPLIAVPTAMLTMSSKSSDAENKTQANQKSGTDKKSTTSSLPPGESPSDQLLKAYFGRKVEESAGPDESAELAISVRQHCLPTVGSKFIAKGLIVTLPDPQDSSLTHLFDVRLDVLRKAAATHGYTLNRFYLPWKRDHSESEAMELPRNEPGLLLFRRRHQKLENENDDQAETDVLLMYLVGETPTSGVQYQAFHKAVNRLLFWTREKPSLNPELVDKQVVDVIAPSFSGAAESLAQTIQSHKPKEVHFRVVSGAANSLDRVRFERLSNTRASLYATRPSASHCQDALLKFVSEHKLTWRPTRIAWLVESSGFGISVSRPNHQLPAQPRKRKINQSVEVTNFSFPLHVARVRRELDKQRSKKERLPLHAVSSESQLALGDEDATARLDVTPLFAPEITPALDELQLRQVMTTIRQGEFSFVGITASDPRDMAFLCELIRQHCPDAQILLVGGSTTFVHPTQRQFMRGAVAATGYPLHLTTQSWTFPWGANSAPVGESGTLVPSSMMIPDSDSSAGVYNAAVLLLASPKLGRWEGSKFTLDGGRSSEPNPELQLIDYGEPFGVGRELGYQPTVWISAIGDETLVPLATHRPIEDSTSSPAVVAVVSNAQATYRHPSLTIPFSGGVFAALIVAMTVYCWLISLELSRRRNTSESKKEDESDTKKAQSNRGWWRTWTDNLMPLLMPRSIKKTISEERFSPRKRQLGALLATSLVMWLLTTWLTGLMLVPVILNAYAAGTTCFWISIVALIVLIAKCSDVARRADVICRTESIARPKDAINHRIWLPVKVWCWVIIAVVVGAFLYATGLAEVRILAGDLGFKTTHWLGMLGSFHCAWFWLATTMSLFEEMFFSPKTPRSWAKPALWTQVGLIVSRGLVSRFWIDDHSSLNDEWAQWAVLRFAQTMSITNNVSLLQSTLWLVLAIIVWSGFILRRLLVSEQHKTNSLPWEHMTEQALTKNPLAAVSARMTHTKDFIDDVLTTGCRALRQNFAVSFVVTFSAALLWQAHLARWSAVSFNSVWTTWFVWGVAGVASLAWVHTFWQAVVLRQMIHKLLRQMAWMTTLTESMGRLPERIRIVVGSFMDIRQKRASYFRIRVQYLTYLLQNFGAVQHRSHWATLLTDPVPLETSSTASDDFIQSLLKPDSDQSVEHKFCDELQHVPVASGPRDNQLSPIPITRDSLNHFGMRVWNGLLTEWHDRPPHKLYPSGTSSDDELTKGVKKLAENLSALNHCVIQPTIPGKTVGASESKVSADDWVRVAEEFVAMQVVGYLHNVLTFLYSLIWFLLAMTVLFVLGALTWPLQPQKLLTGTAITMLLMVTLFCVMALLALERDRVHSILRGTTPDRIDFDRGVLIKLATCLAPVVLLVSSYLFPDAVQWVSNLVEPVMHSAK